MGHFLLAVNAENTSLWQVHFLGQSSSEAACTSAVAVQYPRASGSMRFSTGVPDSVPRYAPRRPTPCRGCAEALGSRVRL